MPFKQVKVRKPSSALLAAGSVSQTDKFYFDIPHFFHGSNHLILVSDISQPREHCLVRRPTTFSVRDHILSYPNNLRSG